MEFGSNSMAVMLNQHTVSASSSSIAPCTMGLSMAETLAQGPPRSLTPPQLSVSTQKLEEFAPKQSRLLIPITPSMPRALVVRPSEKSKVKTQDREATLSFIFTSTQSFSRGWSCKLRFTKDNFW